MTSGSERTWLSRPTSPLGPARSSLRAPSSPRTFHRTRSSPAFPRTRSASARGRSDPTMRRLGRWLPLAAVVAGAAALRLWGLTQGLPNVNTRPDERELLEHTARFAAGDLNPRWFVCPNFYFYLVWAWEQRSEEHTSELQSHSDLVCRLPLEKKNDV